MESATGSATGSAAGSGAGGICAGAGSAIWSSSPPDSRNVVSPKPMVSPSASVAAETRCSLTKVPLWLPRSTMRYPPGVVCSSAWWRETLGWGTMMSLSGTRPMRRAWPAGRVSSVQSSSGPSSGSPSRIWRVPSISIRSARRPSA